MNPVAAAEAHRVFLFLQGPSSSLFYKIAAHLEAAGHTCLRVNLNVGDWLFWRRRGGLNYRGRFSDWPAYIDKLLASRYVTDLVLLGEERPYHRIAVDLAKSKNIAVTVIEMGYLRPDWITVERDGMSSNSRFPNDPRQIRQAALGLPSIENEIQYRQSFFVECLFDLSYNLPNVFLPWFYPNFERHGIFHPLIEYAGWIRRLAVGRLAQQQAKELMSRLTKEGSRYFVYTLQLETDYQLRSHSPFPDQESAIEMVLCSFASNAPPDTEIIVKVHPLDNGLRNWKNLVTLYADRFGIKQRVSYLDGGDFEFLLDGTLGIVCVNSTAALIGLRKGIQVKVLGSAIYDIEGITHQASLDSFWSTPEVPDPLTTAAFFNLLAASIQERGNFYSREGTNAASRAVARRLIDGLLNYPGGDCGYVPRARPIKTQGR